MIIDKVLNVKISRSNIEHYNMFFNINLGDIIEIDVELHLQKGSNRKINVSCDICYIQRYITFYSYIKNINSSEKYPIYTCDKCSHIKLKEFNRVHYGAEYFSQTDEYNDKFKSTMMERYGVEHALQSKELKDKFNKTCLEKFGFTNPFMDTDKIKKSFMAKYGVAHPSQFIDENGNCKFHNWVPLSEKSAFEIYKKDVRNKTKKNSKTMEWDGTDYYDGEFIKNNFTLYHLSNNYPTIDHKTSIFDGFINKIPVEDIAKIENLCWTKRIINITKNRKSSI